MVADKPENLCRSGLRYLWVSLIVIVLDQLSKQWIIENVQYLRERIDVLPFFAVIHVRNEGAAFSFLSDQGGWQVYLFSLLAIGISSVLVFMLSRQPIRLWRINLSFSLIIGGAIGNLIDRLLHGAVIDFLDFYIGQSHWPAFNLADSAIICGAILMLLDGFMTASKEKQ